MDSLNKTLHSLSSANLDGELERGRNVSRRHLIDKLNYVHFQDRPIFINLKHVKYNNTISLQAKPLPCSNERLDCVWCDTSDLDRILAVYRFHNFTIVDDKKILLVEAEVVGMNEQGFCLLLPELCREVGSRRMKRHLCTGAGAVLTQNGAELRGMLHDFTAVSFRIELSSTPPQSLHWIDAELPVHLRFSEGEETLFSGECRIIRQGRGGKSGTFVLEPLHHQIHRFRSKEYRSVRQVLVPSPHVDFVHPLIKKPISLRVCDLSGSGFSVEEDEECSVLLPGMILPRVEICIAESFRVGCTAQVVYRNRGDGENGSVPVKCGLAVLDMEPEDHARLVAHLNQAADGKSYLDSRVDMDALWRLFFESGFISPQKYASFHENKEEIKRTYDRLYNQRSGIARHFIYQDGGKILGHMAMIRTNENAWLIHHHAAGNAGSLKAGLVVLNQISRYVNDLHHLRSAHLDFVFCYYRPDNKFPNRIFGEFARKLNNPQGCSLDTFAYFHHRQPRRAEQMLPRPWELAVAQPLDIEELKVVYGHRSGGLMPDAFDLGADGTGRDDLAQHYRSHGFRKESHILSLKKDGVPKALLLANITDVGLNLSNLTNCVTAVVLDDTLPRDVLQTAFSIVAAKYDGGDMPVLLSPVSYAEQESFTPEKLYTLWILNLQYLDDYFKFCDTIFRHVDRTTQLSSGSSG